MIQLFAIPLLLQAAATGPVATGDERPMLEHLTVTGRRVANQQPAGGYAAAATALRFDPQVNLQSRGLPEDQADVTVRGGLFENTGFRLGAVTVHDPQTGHFAVELPFDPALLSTPELLTDFENGLKSFNASVATVNYGFTPVADGGRLTVGAGSHGLLHAAVRAGETRALDGGRFGAVLAASASRGDGSVENGDHEFKRFSGQLQWLGEERETNLLLGYQDKFSAWPGMYTGFASLPETDRGKLGLALLDHRWSDNRGHWQAGTAWRRMDNDYDFDRRTQESGTPGSFEHETRSFSLGFSGVQRLGGLDWHLGGQYNVDRLVRSTDLVYGDFDSRNHGSLAVAPGREWRLSSGASASLRAGLRADLSNRDENALSPLFRFAYRRRADAPDRFDIEYTATTQLPGFTALNSRPEGLFGGNPELGREYADTLKLGWTGESDGTVISAALFHRRDEDLVDWTWRRGAPSLRQANAVDIDVTGFEWLYGWQGSDLELVAAYAWLRKDADYGKAEVDASYYALNFARHRLTLAAVYRPSADWELRLDNEVRRYEKNALRGSGDGAWMASLSIAWRPASVPGLDIRLVADNLADDDFQEFPGTPAAGRAVSLGLALDW